MIFSSQNRLTEENLLSFQLDNPPENDILVSIKTSIRNLGPIGFEKVKEHLHEIHVPSRRDVYNIYIVIAKFQDYRIASWDYGKFKQNLFVYMSEQDWIALKNEIVGIFSKYNLKRARLREHIQYNAYRSVTCMFADFLWESCIALDSIFRHLYEGRRDLSDSITWKDVIGIILLFIGSVGMVMIPPIVAYFDPRIFFLIFVVIYLWCLPMVVDFLLCWRFSFFRRHHNQFILNVLQNNVDLDPAAANEVLIMEMTDLAEKVTRRHPGVNCVFRVVTEHIHRNGSRDSHDEEHFELSFLKNVPSDEEASSMS